MLLRDRAEQAQRARELAGVCGEDRRTGEQRGVGGAGGRECAGGEVDRVLPTAGPTLLQQPAEQGGGGDHTRRSPLPWTLGAGFS
ncbi:hypothetical protein OG905_01930 [Streptomyces sp. NBC_00322]|uniref:hypothetical protein n=1 Tax=Streptomyces sp. NBC_00322 TaxID=2975712 RepID=UPI002E2DEABE|nr:hypothetical protein [Streptomyces sp. NBC_00322]